MSSNRSRITLDLVGDDGKQLHDLLSYYRLLRQESWQQLILLSLEMFVSTENEAIAKAVEMYRLNHLHGKIGRPRGSKQPASMKRNHSKLMKEYWKNKKATIQNINV